MSQSNNEGTAAAALGAHSKDANPSSSRDGRSTGRGGAASDSFMQSASQSTSEIAHQLSDVVRQRPLVALVAAGVGGLLLGLAVAKR
jgi:ElaB/YqjD/DUF883 family membrane-anchored ribosome-binding protein